MTRFDDDTSFKRLDDTIFERDIDRSWWGDKGPHGGYLAALIQRASRETVADPARAARSTTLHFLAPPTEGTVRITTRIERAGRSLTAVSSRLEQGGETKITAFSTFSAGRESFDFSDLTMPEAPAPADVPRVLPGEHVPAFLELFEYRFALGPMPFSGADTALAGAWMRADETRPLDDTFAAFLTDACVPPIFARNTAPVGVPTIDLSIHFARALPRPQERPGEYVLGVFRAEAAHDGFMLEDGEIWSESGDLLVRSRQLALLLPGRPA
jgi:acyl-CoA thioesterase